MSGMGYYVVCRQCGDGTKPVGPFPSPEARSAWIAEHNGSTGHDSWFERDQPDNPSDFD
jgi:hypothetical protein